MTVQRWLDETTHHSALVEVFPSSSHDEKAGTGYAWDIRIFPEELDPSGRTAVSSVHHAVGTSSSREETSWYEAFLEWTAWRTAQLERLALWRAQMPPAGTPAQSARGARYDAELYVTLEKNIFHWKIDVWAPWFPEDLGPREGEGIDFYQVRQQAEQAWDDLIWYLDREEREYPAPLMEGEAQGDVATLGETTAH